MKRALRNWLVLGVASMSTISWAADQNAIDPADVQMAEEFGAMGARTLARKDISRSIWTESEALMMAAGQLNAREPRWPLLAARYATRAGDTPGIIDANQHLLALDPGNRGAQLQMIDIYLAQMETADQKAQYLQSLISKNSLAGEVRSYAAVRLAYVQLERSQTAEARASLGQAINLNPLNLEALRAQYRIVEENGSLLEKTIATLGLLRANPADPDMIWRLAADLSQAGLEKESINWYDLAAQTMPRAGQALPEDLLVDYFTAIYLSGDSKTAMQVIDKALAGDANAPRLWMLRAALERQENSPHLSDTIAKASVAYFDVIQEMRQRTGVTDATTRPVDLAEPVTLPDMSGDAARVTADTSGMLRHYYADNVADWAWVQIYFAHKPDDAEPMLQLLTHLVPAEDPLTRRLRGWSDFEKGDMVGAQAQFAAAPNDPLCQMGMIEIERKHDEKAAQSQARKLLSANSVGIIGALLYSDLKGKGVDLLPSNESQAVLEQLKRFPIPFMDVLGHPEAFYAIHLDPIKVSCQYDEPMLVRVAIQNLTGIDLTIGDDALIHPTILLDAQQKGIGDQLYPGVAYGDFHSATLLHGGDEISQIVRVDAGAFGLMLLNNPESELQYSLLGTSNPIPVKDQVYIGLAGMRVQMPRIIERLAASLSSQEGRDHLMQSLQSGDGGEKMRAIVLLADYAAQYLAEANPNPAQKKAAADLLHIIDQNSHTGTASLDAMGAFATARIQTGTQKWNALQKLADDSNWQRQLLAAFAMAGAPVDMQKKVYQNLSTGDHDAAVKKYAGARLETLEHPTTQP